MTYLTKQEAADKAQVAVITINRWLAAGKLSRYAGNGYPQKVYIDEKELDEIITERSGISLTRAKEM